MYKMQVIINPVKMERTMPATDQPNTLSISFGRLLARETVMADPAIITPQTMQ